MWTTLDSVEHAREWLHDTVGSTEAPATFEVEDPDQLRNRVEPVEHEISALPVRAVTLPSGLSAYSVDIRHIEGHDFGLVEGALNDLAARLDEHRTWFAWDDLDDEELPGAHVHHEVHTEIDGLPVLGPGGRYVKMLAGPFATFDLSIHPRTRARLTSWRTVDELSARIAETVQGWHGGRLRGRFGYYEDSAYEVATLIRPVFVFVLDQPDVEDYPRWRVSVVEAATASENEPPELGLEGVGDACI